MKKLVKSLDILQRAILKSVSGLTELGEVTGFKDDEQLQQRTTESNIKQSQTLEQLKEASENEAQKERVDSLIQASAELKTAITENQECRGH